MKNKFYLLKYISMLLMFNISMLAGCNGKPKNNNDSGMWGLLFLAANRTAPANYVPKVTFTNPIATVSAGVSSVNVALNTKVSATFTNLMDANTFSTTTFTLKQGTVAVTGTVTYNGLTAVFTPTANLTASTTYTATISASVKDIYGNSLGTDLSWSFKTGTTTDTIAPTVSLQFPTNSSTTASINSKVSVNFSESIDPSTLTATTFTLSQGATPISGTVSLIGLNALIVPTNALTANTVYTATATTGIKDMAGNAIAANSVWTFTTTALSDSTAPTVASTDPTDIGVNIILSKKISATMSENMDPTTITTEHFTVKEGSTAIVGIVNYVGLVATFIPLNSLVANKEYTATISTGVKDMSGNTLASNKTWTFKTFTGTQQGPPQVDLGTAGGFVILAKTAISTTGATAVTGNLGVSPAAATFITGFGLIMDSTNVFSTSSLVTGKVYAANYTPPTPSNMTTAISDMELAYTDAAGRIADSDPNGYKTYNNLGAGDISAMTLTPGLYIWSTGLNIDNRGVTLSGGVNDTWIFQIAQNITVANTAIITLTGGAKSKNVFWQNAGSVSLGTTSQFKGIMLCKTAIAVNTGASLNGRALAQTAVTLDANAVTSPAE